MAAKKIGILTFHCAHNYGAVLQTYATVRLLADAGHEVEVIDYRPDYLVKPYRRFDLSRFYGKDIISTCRHLVSECLLFPVRLARYSAFEMFINGRFNLSERVTPGTVENRYDTVLIGSDQVWNKKITGGSLDGMYFADPALWKNQSRFIADAVSMESETLSDSDASYIKNIHERFSALSVRESQLSSLLDSRCGVKARHVQDPVIQVNPQVWKEIARPQRASRPYILVYRLRDHHTIDPFVKKLASRTGAEVVEVTPFPDGRKLVKARQCESVEGFLGLLAGASYVVTTSYHAMLFAVIFSRPFYCFRFGTGQDTRQASFLKSVGLEDRMLSLGDDVPEDDGCDFSEAMVRLEELRRESSEFILNSL